MRELKKKMSLASLKSFKGKKKRSSLRRSSPRSSRSTERRETRETRNTFRGTDRSEKPSHSSTSSSLYDAALEDQQPEESQVNASTETVPEKPDGNMYQPFPRSKSPYDVGPHGLYNLGESDELPPPLPPAVPGLVYGRTKQVVLPDNPFLQPGEICSLQDILREPKSEEPEQKPPTLREKVAWKKKQAQALIENPNADPEFAMLPKGLNNRIDYDKGNKEPLIDVIRRGVYTPTSNKLQTPTAVEDAPPTPVPSAIPPPRIPRGAPPRYCPKILPARAYESGPANDEWNNPFGGEYAAFHETPEERAKRIAISDEGREQRKISDQHLRVRGQRQTNDPLIGRPPPLSQRQLAERPKLSEKDIERLAGRLKTSKTKANEYEPLPPKVQFSPQPEVLNVNTAWSDRSVPAASRQQSRRPSHSAQNGGQQSNRDHNEAAATPRALVSRPDTPARAPPQSAQSSLPVRSRSFSRMSPRSRARRSSRAKERSRLAEINGSSTANQPSISPEPGSFGLINPVEPSRSTEPENRPENLPLPPRDARYYEWDQAMLAGRQLPVTPTILPSELPPCPAYTPPPIPPLSMVGELRACELPERYEDLNNKEDSLNPFNIFGITPRQTQPRDQGDNRKQEAGTKKPSSVLKESSESDSDSQYSDNLPPEDEWRAHAAQLTATKNSEGLARLYRGEVDRAHKEVSRLPGSTNRRSPFDEADDDRRRNWSTSYNVLDGSKILPDGFSVENLAKVLPHLANDERKKKSKDDNAPTTGDQGEALGRGQAVSRNDYYPYRPATIHPPQHYGEGSRSNRHARQGIIGRSPQPHNPDNGRPEAPSWLIENREGAISRAGNQNDANRFAFVDDDEIRQPPPGPPPPIPARSPLRRHGEHRFREEDMLRPPRMRAHAVPEPIQRRHRPEQQAAAGGFFAPQDRYQEQRMHSPAIHHLQGVPATASASSHSRSPFLPAASARAASATQYTQYRQYGGYNEDEHASQPYSYVPPSQRDTSVFSPQNPRPLPPLPVASSASSSAASRSASAPSGPAQAAPSERSKKTLWKKPSFLDSGLSAQGVHRARMEHLQVRPAEYNSVKTKAVEDARQMQATVLEVASKAGKIPPKYVLLELIGKGSFGRVYKGKDMTSAAIVAVKIIDIDESDTLNPRLADSYSDFLKEVNALKILSESNAKNINHVIEALPVGKSMWMISEYCGGGSVATLMKPTAPGGLQEKWIKPILREVAEGLYWVHQAGIIHRDIKCANVLITEEGGVQVCDFGVAGIIENKIDKRSTVIGTPHWMAPELFHPNPSYGKEVDIWALGSLVFEIATGLPPNVANGIPYDRLGPHLKHHMPRLEGGNYSNDLRDLVAYCLEELPSERPTIEQVQKHPYIYGSKEMFPTSTLSNLVRAFKMWEDHGGSRKSLFMIGGAQGPSESSSPGADEEWNFSTTATFDQEVSRQSTPQDVFEVYGRGVALDGFFSEETSRPPPKASRRRPPPEALARLPAPLEKIFDPNTLSNYEDNSRNHYGRTPQPPPASDLPLRDDTAQTSIRDTMIDLGGHDSDTGISIFPDMDTIKASRRGGREEPEDDYTSTLHDFSRPALSDPADINTNRRTQDWKFPTMAPPASADSETSRFPVNYDLPHPTVTPGSGARPALIHHPTEPIGGAFGGNIQSVQQATMERLSMRESLIDLDMSMPDEITIPSFTRPSTANSDTGSSTSEQLTSANPFELERHASMYAPLTTETTNITDPEYYITEESATMPLRLRSNSAVRDIAEISDFSASDVENSHVPAVNGKHETGYSDSDMPPPPVPTQMPVPRSADQPYTFARFPDLPAPPTQSALSGTAGHAELVGEFGRMLSGMTGQLDAFRDVYSSPQVVQYKGPIPPRRGDKKDGAGGAAAGSSSNSG